MVHNKNILVIGLLILTIFLVYILEIESDQLAISILMMTCIYVAYGLIVTNTKCDDKGSSGSECLMGNTKSYAGFLDDGCLDVWHVKHALLWFLIGLLAPNHHKLVFIASVLYEISEHIVFKYMCNKQALFCGRLEDVVINTSCYYIGSYVRNKQKRTKQIIENINA